MLTAQELMKKFTFSDAGDGRLKANGYKSDLAKYADDIRAHKDELLVILNDQKAEQEAVRQYVANIPGLQELRYAINEENAYTEAFKKMMETEYNDGVNPPRKPEADVSALKSQYPQAAAYLQAEAWSYASNYVKSGAGKRAMDRISHGEDYKTVIAEMKAEWSKHVDEHIWD